VVTAPRVVVAVGTDHHPFPRLMSWISSWPEGDVDWFVQLDELVAADAVVCHGGPGLIMDVRAAGHRPVVVARRPDLGEHVDSHQVEFVTWLAARSDLRVADDESSFHEQVRAAILDGRGDRVASTSVEVARRFGLLVDELVKRR
jgi:UDP-N-acetylglucosamine transferase subunit ALG13